MRKRFLTRCVSTVALIATLFLTLPLVACGGEPTPQPTLPPVPTVPAVGELLEGAAAGPTTTIGYLYTTPEGSLLADSLSAGAGGAFVPAPGLGVWLEQVPALPSDSPTTPAGMGSYTLVEARGSLEGPGEFGPGGSYGFRMIAPVLEPLGVRELNIPLLLQNSELYEGQPVRLRGQLIAGPDSAILVERLGAGGVPEATALQLKLAAPPRDPAVAAALRPAGSSGVHFGPVEITGLWRAGRLYPLLTIPQPDR